MRDRETRARMSVTTVSLLIRPSRLFLCLLVPSLALVAQFAGAAEPPEKAFVGVTVGVTTDKELRQNEQWGGPVEQTLQEDGSKLLEFRFGIWKKVVTLVESGVVRVIDVTPPDRARADQLSKVLDLGELVPVASRQSLPAGALVGPPVSVEWQPFRSSGAANVLLFAQEMNGKRYARLVRFCALGPPEKPYLGLRIRPITATEAEAAGLDQAVGLCVLAVLPLSPGAESGVKAGDVILEFAEEKVAKSDELVAVTHRQPIGATRPVKIVRNGKTIELDVLLKPRPEHLACFQTAASLYAEGRSREAAPMYSKAIALGPSHATYYQKRSYCLRRLGRYEEALKDAQEAVRLSNASPLDLLARAECLISLGKYQPALSDCEKAIEIDQTLALAFAIRSTIFTALKDDDRALADLNQAIRLDPELASGFWGRGKLFFRQKQYERAIADFTQAIQLDPRSFDSYCTRGWCYFNHGEHTSAADSFRQAIQNLPKHDDVHLAYYGLGVALLNQKKYQEAVTSFNEAIRRNQGFALAYRGRAEALEGLGLSAEAAEDRKKVEALGASRQDAENLVKDHRFAAFERGGGWGTGRYSEYGVWWNSKRAKSRAVIVKLEPGQRPPGSDAATALHINNASPEAEHVFGTTSQKIAVKKGRTYKITFWARSEKLASNGGVFIVVDPQWRVRPINLKGGTYAWTRFEGTFVADDDEADLRIVSANTGDVWITDMTLTE